VLLDGESQLGGRPTVRERENLLLVQARFRFANALCPARPLFIVSHRRPSQIRMAEVDQLKTL
jgi:hypothetical protein